MHLGRLLEQIRLSSNIEPWARCFVVNSRYTRVVPWGLRLGSLVGLVKDRKTSTKNSEFTYSRKLKESLFASSDRNIYLINANVCVVIRLTYSRSFWRAGRCCWFHPMLRKEDFVVVTLSWGFFSHFWRSNACLWKRCKCVIKVFLCIRTDQIMQSILL